MVANAEAHLFRIRLEVADPDPAGQKLSLPNWIPGSYMIRDFARNIISMAGTADGNVVELVKTDKSTWLAPAGLRQLTVEYEVYAWELSVRAAHLDTTHGFFNGTSVFLCVEGQEGKPCELKIERPTGHSYTDWQVATAMPVSDAKSKNIDGGFCQYRTADYDELIDHPVEMGTFERIEFDACGVPHELVLTGRYKTDADRLKNDLKAICEEQIRFFGEPAPMDRYVFLVMVVGDGYGGLEHRASTSLLITRENLPAPGSAKDEPIDFSTAYVDFLGLCSHEYFHTWNVKRIKPARFVPYELKEESYTELLWAFEGITSYYDDLFLSRCGLLGKTKYLRTLGKTITRVRRGSGRLRQSVAESSFDAWTRFYKADENAPNAIVSYYAKGALVALCLDMLIREKSENKHSLDDLMKELWKRWRSDQAGVVQADFESIASSLASEDLSEFFHSAVFGTDDLDLDRALATVGVELNWRRSNSETDSGGNDKQDEPFRYSLGARTKAAPGGLELTHVLDNGPAQAGGLAAGDILVALDNLAVDESSLPKILARQSQAQIFSAHVFRHGVLMEFKVSIKLAPEDTCWLSRVTDKDEREQTRSLFANWIHGQGAA